MTGWDMILKGLQSNDVNRSTILLMTAHFHLSSFALARGNIAGLIRQNFPWSKKIFLEYEIDNVLNQKNALIPKINKTN